MLAGIPRLLLWIALLGGVAAPMIQAEPYRVGDTVELSGGTDQHGKILQAAPGEFRAVIFETPGESGSAEPPKDPEWFTKNQALMVVNISGFSAFKRRIARSRMESKPFRILVVDDPKVADRFPRQKDKFTVLKLDEKGGITAILYAAPGRELQGLFAPAAP
ncbi:MAG: hypothetical protein JNL10_15840 [Verrucomicrobiales bacterium]|nr:hypothetical protein [Verrucomicrobiales bacterium]